MLTLLTLTALTLAAPPGADEATEEPPVTEVREQLEFSFGSSLLIREQSLQGQEQTRMVPVTAVL
ncbi:MAG: hypothetical protein QGG40_17230, partial [Myxococcota bacterium]|nr:hypothetical protein [Myxococcota bacterium]